MTKQATIVLLTISLMLGGNKMPTWTSIVTNQNPWDPNDYRTDQRAHDNAEIAWNYFRSQGFTEEATAGVLGNLTVESYMNPGQIGHNYSISDPYSPKGLMMWTTSSIIDILYSYASEHNKNWYDGDLQCMFIAENRVYPGFANGCIFYPRNGYNYTYDQFKQLTDINECVHAFCWEAEAPGTPHMNNRESAAAYWFTEFTGHQPGQTLPLWMMGRENIRRNIILA